MDKITVIAFILLFEYLFVILMVMADLFSGVQKAKKLNVVRSSYGFRRTVEKLSRYINLLIGLTIVDAIHISAIWYLVTYYSYEIPLFPLFTLVGSMFMAFIELKSIYEKAASKEIIEWNLSDREKQLIQNLSYRQVEEKLFESKQEKLAL